jgi:hypothetical protein
MCISVLHWVLYLPFFQETLSGAQRTLDGELSGWRLWSRPRESKLIVDLHESEYFRSSQSGFSMFIIIICTFYVICMLCFDTSTISRTIKDSFEKFGGMLSNAVGQSIGNALRSHNYHPINSAPKYVAPHGGDPNYYGNPNHNYPMAGKPAPPPGPPGGPPPLEAGANHSNQNVHAPIQPIQPIQPIHQVPSGPIQHAHQAHGAPIPAPQPSDPNPNAQNQNVPIPNGQNPNGAPPAGVPPAGALPRIHRDNVHVDI